jgi:hypothetical protein
VQCALPKHVNHGRNVAFVQRRRHFSAATIHLYCNTTDTALQMCIDYSPLIAVLAALFCSSRTLLLLHCCCTIAATGTSLLFYNCSSIGACANLGMCYPRHHCTSCMFRNPQHEHKKCSDVSSSVLLDYVNRHMECPSHNSRCDTSGESSKCPRWQVSNRCP